MTQKDMILAAAVAVALYLAYSVGHSQGLKAAPEYALAKQMEAERQEAFWAHLDAMESPEEEVCDQIFDMVDELRASAVYTEPARVE